MPNFNVRMEFVNQSERTFQIEFDTKERVRDELLSQGNWVDFKGVLINLNNVICMEIIELDHVLTETS
jgi:hypothetical protein